MVECINFIICLTAMAVPMVYAIEFPIPQGFLVVPKSSSLIASLNQQFKLTSRLADREQSNATAESPLSRARQNLQQLELARREQELLAANPTANSTLLSMTPMPQSTYQSTAELSSKTQLGQSYRGFSVLELELKSESDRQALKELYSNLSAILNDQALNPTSIAVSPYVDIDFWSHKQGPKDQVDVMLSPKIRTLLVGQLNRLHISHRVKIEDLQARLDHLQSANSKPQRPKQSQDSVLTSRNNGPDDGATAKTTQVFELDREDTFFDNYQRLDAISERLEKIVEQNADIAEVKVIGRSSQGRHLRVLQLGYDSSNSAPVTSGQVSRQFGSENNASYILDNFLHKIGSVRPVGSIWIDGGTHAREWISISTSLYLADRLATNHKRCLKFFASLKNAVIEAQNRESRQGADIDVSLLPSINEINKSLLGKPLQKMRPRTGLEKTLEALSKRPQQVSQEHGCDLESEQLLRRYKFYIMPVLNPDGYEYSHTNNRLWRKTRSTNQHAIYKHFCVGTDPNRNYDVSHGVHGSSTHPCSQTYAGTTPFTEPETKHQSNFIYANRENMKLFISLHSYSQMILMPYSYSRNFAPDHKDLESVGQAAAKAIEKTHGVAYQVGSSASILYSASGTASDWAYERAKIKYSYTIELRDTGTNGFLLPKTEIIPTGEETFNGLTAMIHQMEINERILTSKSISNLDLNMDNSSDTISADYLHVPDRFDPARNIADQPIFERVMGRPHRETKPILSIIRVIDRRPCNSSEPSVSAGEPPNTTAPGLALDPDESHARDDMINGLDYDGKIDENMRRKMTKHSIFVQEMKTAQLNNLSNRIAQKSQAPSGGRGRINSPIYKEGAMPAVRKRESYNSLKKMENY